MGYFNYFSYHCYRNSGITPWTVISLPCLLIYWGRSNIFWTNAPMLPWKLPSHIWTSICSMRTSCSTGSFERMPNFASTPHHRLGCPKWRCWTIWCFSFPFGLGYPLLNSHSRAMHWACQGPWPVVFCRSTPMNWTYSLPLRPLTPNSISWYSIVMWILYI